MARRGAKQSQSEGDSAGSVVVVAGTIRAPDEVDALAVKLSIWDTEVTMRADGSELGHWPASAVAITPLDGSTFEFIAEGDHLIFETKEAEEFSQHPLVRGTTIGKRRKRRSQRKATPALVDEQLRWDESSDVERALDAKRAKAAKPSRRERKAAAGEAAPTVSEAMTATNGSRARTVPKPQARPEKEPRVRKEKEPRVRKEREPRVRKEREPRVRKEREPRVRKEREPRVRKEREPRVRKEREPRVRKERSPRSGEPGWFSRTRHEAWIVLLDAARSFDLFGLDRVQVTDAMREDPNHTHTWNSRVAAKTGPGSYICTACGVFKRSVEG